MTSTSISRLCASWRANRLLIVACLTGAALSAAAPENARSEEITRVGGWTVFYADEEAPLCGISAQYKGGSILTVKRSTLDPSFFVQVFNREWTSIRNGEDYDLIARFSGRGGGVYATKSATGVNEDGLLGLSFAVGSDFVKDFRRQHGVDLYLRNGRKLGGFSLKNTSRAMTVLAECVETLIEPAARDPFRGLEEDGRPDPDPGRPELSGGEASVDI